MFASFCLLPNKPVNENTIQKLSFSPSKTNMYIYKNTFQIQRNVSPKHTIAWRTIEFSPELKQIHGNTFQGNVSWKKNNYLKYNLQTQRDCSLKVEVCSVWPTRCNWMFITIHPQWELFQIFFGSQSPCISVQGQNWSDLPLKFLCMSR